MRDEIYDSSGKHLGRVVDMILDTHGGCVRYVVIALGGFLGMRRRRLAIPWSAVTPDLDCQRCVLDVHKMALMAVPVSDDDPWLQKTQLIRSPDRRPSISAPYPGVIAARFGDAAGLETSRSLQ
jgi:hypothetical protein